MPWLRDAWPSLEHLLLRTSSAANVGADKDSDKRQRAAIQGYAKRAGFELVAEHYDAAVNGADPIEGRKGFADLLDRVENNGVATVIVGDASRFARELGNIRSTSEGLDGILRDPKKLLTLSRGARGHC